jgi:hypothetical protein
MATESIVLEEELPENYEPTDDGALWAAGLRQRATPRNLLHGKCE